MIATSSRRTTSVNVLRADTQKLGEKMRSDMRSFRVVNLHTLCQGNPHVKFEDYVCLL